MRIGIDAHMVGARETGNETYVVELLRALTALGEGDEYLALVTDHSDVPMALKQPGVKVAPVLPRSNLRRLLFALPRQAKRLRLDGLHVTYHGPPLRSCPLIVSVHDVSYRFYPEAFSPRDRLLHNSLIPLTLRRAAKVLTLSENSRRDLARAYGVPAERIAVTPLAAAPQFRRTEPSEQAAALARYGITQPYALAVGTLQPRKNLARLLMAFRRALEQRAEPLRLAVAGPEKWSSSSLYRAATEAGIDGLVHFIGYAAAEDLPLLYGAAEMFIYPSLYEGFGLPVLEAMACGAPVICSDSSSLPEVAGDAALLVDPLDTKALACAIARLRDDPALRAELRALGFKRSAQFSWGQTARLTAAVYRSVLQRRPVASGASA